MTPDEINLVRQGFDRIAPRAEQIGFEIYERLFAMDPPLRALFHIDMATQVRHFMGAVAMVVRSLDNLATILEQIQTLGRRHAGYGVQPHHFAMAGVALIDTLEARLGNAFTPEARAAWMRAYETLAGAMVAAMADTMRQAA
jgi:hemoglobin-like flavoprotein